MKNIKYIEPIYVCPDCGSENVLEPTWVYANGNPQVIGHRIEGVDFDLCEDCYAQMSIITKEEYKKEGAMICQPEV